MAAKKKSPSKSSKRTVKAGKSKTAPAKRTAAKKGASAKSRPPKRGGVRKPAPKKRTPAKRKAPARAPKASPLPEAPEALALAEAIAQVAREKKALDVVIVDTRARAPSVGCDYIVLATGESDRQLGAIHDGVESVLKPRGQRAAVVEASPDWVCVTYDEGVVAHFLTPERREVMDFEGLWAQAPRVS